MPGGNNNKLSPRLTVSFSQDPKKTLGIKLPFLVMIIKNVPPPLLGAVTLLLLTSFSL
jgi:hypothetical protein